MNDDVRVRRVAQLVGARGDSALSELLEASLEEQAIAPPYPAVSKLRHSQQHSPVSVEVCAGAGGQALGLEQAGFEHSALIEIDSDAARTLRFNRPKWDVRVQDLNSFDGKEFVGIDLFAGGLPCPPFSVAGKMLGENDERNLFPAALRLIDEIRPKAILIENVRGIFERSFDQFRSGVIERLSLLGYEAKWKLLNSSELGVPQLRPRAILVALTRSISDRFDWPMPAKSEALTVGDVLYDLIAARGWLGAKEWRALANKIAPTIVGGSKKHGGPDLGPTRAKRAWAELGVDAHGVADDAPDQQFTGKPRLTVRMIARLQGFPDSWAIVGRKTSAYRQIGNAFPPPVAKAVGERILRSLPSRGVIVNCKPATSNVALTKRTTRRHSLRSAT